MLPSSGVVEVDAPSVTTCVPLLASSLGHSVEHLLGVSVSSLETRIVSAGIATAGNMPVEGGNSLVIQVLLALWSSACVCGATTAARCLLPTFSVLTDAESDGGDAPVDAAVVDKASILARAFSKLARSCAQLSVVDRGGDGVIGRCCCSWGGRLVSRGGPSLTRRANGVGMVADGDGLTGGDKGERTCWS